MTDSDEKHWRRRLVTIAARDYYYESDDFGARIDAQVATLTRWLTDPNLEGREFQHEPLIPQTRSDITDFVVARRLDSAEIDDVLVVYITGHGVTKGSGNHYLVLADSDEEHPLLTCYPTVDLLAAVLGSQAEHVLMIVDSCCAGALHRQWAALSRDLPKSRRELKTLTVIASADFDVKVRVGEFAELLRLVYERLRGPAEITGRYLTINELFTEIGSVLAQHPELGEPMAIWPPFTVHPTGTPCLPNPAYVPPTELVDAPRQQVSITKTELDDYWISRASGRVSNEDPGWYFSGRVDLMRSLVNFLRTGEGILVVTGVAGSGKSAILARAVTLSDPSFRRDNPAISTGIHPSALPPMGCIDAAILAREKDTEQVSAELLALLGAKRSPSGPSALQDLRGHLIASQRPLLVTIDGVDEATHPDRLIIDVLAPLARLANNDGTPLVRLILGLRSEEHSSPQGEQGLGLLDLLQRAAPGVALHVARTDEKPTVSADIKAYLTALLSVRGPYVDATTSSDRVVELVAAYVSPSFLDARLAGDRLRDAEEVQDLSDSAWLATLADGTVSLFRADLADTAHALERSAAHVLAALQATAFAIGRGVPWGDIWPVMANAVHGEPISDVNSVISEVLHSRLAGYLTQDSEDGRIVHRPNHARLAEALTDKAFPLNNQHGEVIRLVSPTGVHASIATELGEMVDPIGAIPPHPYLARHLIDHAYSGGVLNDVHVPASLLPWEPDARVRGLLGLPPPSSTSSGRLTAWASIEPFLSGTAIAARQLSLAFACSSAGLPLPPNTSAELIAPTWTRWSLPPGNVLAVSSPDSAWLSMEAFSLPGGRMALGAGNSDGFVRVWDPLSGTAIGEPWHAHEGGVRALAALLLHDGRTVLITGGVDGVLRVWDPLSGNAIGDPWTGHRDMVTVVAALPLPDKRVAVVTGGADGVVRLWDPISGGAIGNPLRRRGAGITSLVTLTTQSGQLVVVAGTMNGMVMSWDPLTGNSLWEDDSWWQSETKPIMALEVLTMRDRHVYVAASGMNGSVQVRDPITGEHACDSLSRHRGGVSALAAIPLPDRRVGLVTGDANGLLQLWDPFDGATIGDPWRGHSEPVTASTTLRFSGGRAVLATCGLDQAVRVWDPLAEAAPATRGLEDVGRTAVAEIRTVDGRSLLVCGGAAGALQAFDSTLGTVAWEHAQDRGHQTTDLIALPMPDGQVLLASSDERGYVQLWDPINGSESGAVVFDHGDPITAMVVLSMPKGRVLLVTGDSYGFTRMWDPIDGSSVGDPLDGEGGSITALAGLSLPDGRVLLACGDEAGLIQFWDPIDASVKDRKHLLEVDDLIAFETRGEYPIDVAAVGDPVHAHKYGVNALAVLQAGDGRPLLVSGGSDGAVRLWDPESRNAVGHAWPASDNGVNALAVLQHSGDCAFVASGGTDGTLRLWDAQHGVEVARVVTGRRIQSLSAFREDSQWRLAIVGDGGVACFSINLDSSAVHFDETP